MVNASLILEVIKYNVMISFINDLNLAKKSDLIVFLNLTNFIWEFTYKIGAKLVYYI